MEDSKYGSNESRPDEWTGAVERSNVLKPPLGATGEWKVVSRKLSGEDQSKLAAIREKIRQVEETGGTLEEKLRLNAELEAMAYESAPVNGRGIFDKIKKAFGAK